MITLVSLLAQIQQASSFLRLAFLTLFHPALHKQASYKLVEKFPILLGTEEQFSWVFGGTHSFQNEFFKGSPPIDVAFPMQGFFFSFLPKHGGSFHPRWLLEEAFRRRLRYSTDVAPLLPIFVNPFLILRCAENEQLASYLNEQWHEAVSWALKQLPPITEENPIPGTADSRRLLLEEASTYSLL